MTTLSFSPGWLALSAAWCAERDAIQDVPPAAFLLDGFATGGVAGSSQRLGSEPTGSTLTASTVTCGQVSESAVNSPPETPGGSDTTPFFDREGGAARRAGVGSARRPTETPGVTA